MSVESRLVDLQNKVGVISAKLDAFMKSAMKDSDIKAIKLPKMEVVPDESAHPYQYLLDREPPISTIEVPVVLAEGKRPSDVVEPKEEVDMSTIEPPVTPTPEDPNAPPPPPSAPPPAPGEATVSA